MYKYSELNEWQGRWIRILFEFFIFMTIYTFGSAYATTVLTDENGVVRYGLVIDIACLVYFALAVWLFVRYRFTKYRYCLTEDGMIKIFRVVGKSEQLMLNVEKSCVEKIKTYDHKGELKEYGPLMNYCVIDKNSVKYICAISFEGKKYRFVFQPSQEYVKLISPEN